MQTEEKKTQTVGSFCWHDLAATDCDITTEFYSKLLGWTSEVIEMGEGKTYTMLKNAEEEVGGLYRMDEQTASAGIPSYWTSYVLVEDIAGATQKAKELGATIIMEPFDVGGHGMMSVITDPTGASFALWKNLKDPGTVKSGPGTFCWTELCTPDIDKAGEFYKGLFGWSQEQMPFPDMRYDVFKIGEEPVAGMMTLPEEAKANGAPPHWLIYVAVNDCDQTVEKAKELGGTVVMGPIDFEGVGRGAVIMDKTGGAFGVIKLNEPEESC